MPGNLQLLKQVRNAAIGINQTTDNPEYQALLTATDYVLNELMLQDDSAFYIDYIERGKAVLEEGRILAC